MIVIDVHYQIWKAELSKTNVILAPKLMPLVSCEDLFKLNVLKTGLQAAIWGNTSECNPSLEPQEYGWPKDTTTNLLKCHTVMYLGCWGKTVQNVPLKSAPVSLSHFHAQYFVTVTMIAVLGVAINSFELTQ